MVREREVGVSETFDRKARKEAERQSKRQKQGKGQNKNRGDQKSGLNQKVEKLGLT